MASQEEEIISRLRDVEGTLRKNGIFQALHPPPGPYALFHHLSFAQGRIADVRFIFTRMVEHRRELDVQLREGLRLRRIVAGDDKSASQDAQSELSFILGRETYLWHALRLDFESVYTFGAIF